QGRRTQYVFTNASAPASSLVKCVGSKRSGAIVMCSTPGGGRRFVNVWMVHPRRVSSRATAAPREAKGTGNDHPFCHDDPCVASPAEEAVGSASRSRSNDKEGGHDR